MGATDRVPSCRHLREMLCERRLTDGSSYYVYGCNHSAHQDTTLEFCAGCPDYARQMEIGAAASAKARKVRQPPYDNPPKPSNRRDGRKWRQMMRSNRSDGVRSSWESDPATVCDRSGRVGGMAGLYYGADIYLLLGGPSVKSLELSLLDKRGVISMAVNNAALTHRTQMFICGDPPRKFHDAIWRDPGILCFLPKPKLWNEIYERRPSGRIDSAYEQVKYQPGVVGFERNTFFNPPTFLSEPTINWGNSRRAHNDWEPVLSTMFAALKMCYWLGAFRVFLLGCDWKWDYSAQPYHFPMTRGANVYASNNASYQKMTPMMEALKPVFDAAGFEVWNCNKDSGLTVFPFMSFGDAIESTTQIIPQELTGYNWYGASHDEGDDEPNSTGSDGEE